MAGDQGDSVQPDQSNWTEPLLHPQIHELIGAVRARGVHCSISTSLNVLRAPDLLMQANPDWLRVSVSGFTQEIYARGHKADDIEGLNEIALCERTAFRR